MPAYGNYGRAKGYDAAAALTKHRAVKFSAEETVTPVTAITDVIAGVNLFDVSAAEILKGKGATVLTEGIAEWEASAAITVGALVTIASDGRCKTAATGERVVGTCRKGASGAGARAAVELSLAGHLAP